MRKRRTTASTPWFVLRTLAELKAIRFFFLTLDDELERLIEGEDLVTRAESTMIASHEQATAAEEALVEEYEDPLAYAYEELYWEELRSKFLPHFYAAIILLIVAVLEAGLTRLARFAQTQRRLPISAGQIKGSTLDQFEVLAKLAGWPLPTADLWDWAVDLYYVRNALIHEAGTLHGLSHGEMESRTSKLRAIARRRKGLRVEAVDQLSTEQLLDEIKIQAGRKRKKSRRRPAVSFVTIVVEREFCSATLDQVRAFLDQLYEPLVGRTRQRSRSRTRTRRRPR